MNRILLSLVVMLALGLSCFVFTSCEEEDPAEALVRQSPAPAPVQEQAPAEPVEASPAASGESEAADAPAPEEADGEAAEGEATPAEEADVAAEEVAEAEADGEAEEATEGEAADEEAAPEEAEAVEPEGEETDAAGEEGADEMDAAEELAGEMAAELGVLDEEAEVPAEPAELTPEEKIENFRNLDPRTIITAKYDDLEEQKTTPWDEEDLDEFIPQTGRVDPLTFVRDSIPDELKPTRTGETDQNEIDTYFIAAECTMAVESISAMLQVYNVIEIGTEKRCTLGIGGQRFTVPEGGGTSQVVSVYGSIPIVAGFTVTGISSEQVTISITASGQGTTTSISKTKVFIPRV